MQVRLKMQTVNYTQIIPPIFFPKNKLGITFLINSYI